MLLQAMRHKSNIQKIEKKYPDKMQQFKALQEYGKSVKMPENQLHYYPMPFEEDIEEQLSDLKGKIHTFCELEVRKFWRRVLPFIVLIVVLLGLAGIIGGIIKLVVSVQKWVPYPNQPFRWQ
ncbi:MAG: hypothetical protein WAM28_06110 [Chlamydiales bacterium]